MIESDSNIAGRIRNGETELFRQVVESLKDRAFSLIMKILKNREDAEDVLQESFLKLFKIIMAGEYKSNAKLSTFFYTIVYNTAIDYYRKFKKKSFNTSSIEIFDSDYKEGDELIRSFENKIDKNIVDTKNMSIEKNYSETEVKYIIKTYIESIPEQYSVILNLFFINDFSHEEISQLLKLPIGTVKNRIFRAKEKLREILLMKYEEDELRQYLTN